MKKNKILNMQKTGILIMFFISAACNSGKKETDTASAGINPPTPSDISIVQHSGVTSMIKLPAQLAAFQEVSIFPKVNGYVQSVLVDIGSVVKKGQLLMTLEAPELEQSSVQARERYARSKADFSTDKEHYARLVEASQTPGAVSPLDLSTLKGKLEADSALCNAEKSNWEMHQTMESYLKVIAPFDGVITERNVHPGALVSAEAKDSKPMLELKEVYRLRLLVDIPESIAGSIKNRDTVSFYTSAFPGKKMTGMIDRKSMDINAQFRSERMEIDVINKNGELSPGMYADVVFYSNGNSNALSVPRSALVVSTERKYVIAIRNGKTKKLDVSTGSETTDRIEVYGDLHAGDTVITRANDETAEGVSNKK
jgi:membrane fusion protein, multidrug efflux system